MSIFLTDFTFIERVVVTYSLHGPMLVFVDRLGFSLSLLGLFPNRQQVRDKIVAVFMSKNTLSRHQPTNSDLGSVSRTSVQNKRPPAPNQNNQSTQTGVKKFSSSKRTLTSQQPKQDPKNCSNMSRKQDPKNCRNMAAIKEPRL